MTGAERRQERVGETLLDRVVRREERSEDRGEHDDREQHHAGDEGRAQLGLAEADRDVDRFWRDDRQRAAVERLVTHT